MSSRDALWYCHECHAEMRPLMVPDPVCASCHGSFVEKIEDPTDDPRHFAHNGGEINDDGHIPPGMDTFLLGLQTLMERGMRGNTTQRTNSGSSFSLEVRGPGGSRTVRVGGTNTLGRSNGNESSPEPPNAVPNMSTFLRTGPFGMPLSPGNGVGQDGPSITGPLMAQYLMAMLGSRDPSLLFGGMPESGRMGDYVFNQEALDQVITQMMENSNAHRPVPAPDDVISKLPRELLMEGSATLQQDCAVCKDQFKLGTDDPDEQVVVTLPCKHPFHEPCILPWLKSSGTCPVCRYALVPQPEHHPLPPQSPGSDSGRRSNSSSGASGQPRSESPNRGPEPGGLFNTIFGGLTGHGNNNNNDRLSNTPRSPSRSPTFPGYRPRSPPHRSNSDPSLPSSPQSGTRNRNDRNRRDHLPGGWSEDLD